MKIKDFFTKSKKRTIIIICCTIAGVVITAIAVIAFFLFAKDEGGNFSFSNMNKGKGAGQNFSMDGVVTASGVVSVGTKAEIFEVEKLTTSLEIEEIYVSSEETVEKGTKLLKLSDESVATAREELEQAVKETELAYRLGVIEYEQSKITALYDKEEKTLSKIQAQAVYDQTVSSLQDAVDKAQSELNNTKN